MNFDVMFVKFFPFVSGDIRIFLDEGDHGFGQAFSDAGVGEG